METICAILAIAPTRKLFIQQLDVKGAYLNGKLKERIYMRQPEGHDNGTGRICLLIKTLYGLKQAGQEWNLEFDAKLRKKGYKWLWSDTCMYIWRIGDDFVTITVWVDDMLTFVTTVDLQKKAKADVESKWEITDLGIPSKIIGIELTISLDSIFISSSKYIDSILLREDLGRTNSVSMPLNPNITLVPNPEGSDGDQSNLFASLLGELQYIANTTRPDITYAVNRLAAYTANPSLQHHTALKQILRYLSGTRTHGITYKALPDCPNFFSGYIDASYGNVDKYRSITRYVFLAGEGAITWCLRKQNSIVLSSTQAEYVALSEAAHEACWLWNLYMELGLLDENVPTLIRGDNDRSLAMAQNPLFYKRSKHIAICWHWVCKLVQEGTITVDSCHNPKQTADILTKALPHQKHTRHVAKMGLASA